MIHTVDDFYNKVAKEIRGTYFPTENHGLTDNPKYWESTKAMEDFNNSLITYRTFISRLAKSCNDTNYNINNIVEKYIVSYGSYTYKPRYTN